MTCCYRGTFRLICLLFTLTFSQLCCPNEIFFRGKFGLLSATEPTVYAGCFSVSTIHRILTWTTGSLTCTQMLTHATAHGGCTDTVRESTLKVDSGRKIPCLSGESKPVSAACRSDALPTELHPHPRTGVHENQIKKKKKKYAWKKEKKEEDWDGNPHPILIPLRPTATWWRHFFHAVSVLSDCLRTKIIPTKHTKETQAPGGYVCKPETVLAWEYRCNKVPDKNPGIFSRLAF